MSPIATRSPTVPSRDSSQARRTAVEFCAATIDLAACRRYTLACQTSQGGFCFYAYPEWGVEEPNAPDTWAAVAILDLLNSPMPRAAQCRAWLAAEQDTSGGYPTLVIGHAVLRALRLLGAEPRRDPRPFLVEMARRLGLADPSRMAFSEWLVAARDCIELWQSYAIAISERERVGIGAALARLRHADGGFGAPASNLPETAAAVTLTAAAGLPVDPKALAYVRRCEGGPYGFNTTPSAVSSGLAVHLAGLEVLRHFGEHPREPTLSRRYVARCQTLLGGFGRVPGAIARLDDSLRALQVLSKLAERR